MIILLLPARALAAQWSYSSTLEPCSGEKLYNVNTAMCYKTYQCLQNICFGLDMQRIILEQQGGLLGV